ncbi:MAG: metallophosphoesterase [Methanosarcinaceae archaeon]|nr:metallophosphoesterase [Methanosarcinaceae archaeon]
MPALNELADLLASTCTIFKKEKAVVSVDSPSVMFIGDIHGNLKALDFLLKMQASSGPDNLVLLGDYVDRGPDSVAVLSKLLKLKIARPDRIILLRGNHEAKEMNLKYGFFQEIGFNDELLDFANMVFAEMPVAAVVNNEIFCVHGGIAGLVEIGSIRKTDAFEYLWNDPSPLPGMTPSPRGMGPKCFGEDIFSKFMQKNGLSLMVRGHSALTEGYKWWFGKKLLSVFSTPEYCGCSNNGAFATFVDGEMRIYEFGPGAHSRQYRLLQINK